MRRKEMPRHTARLIGSVLLIALIHPVLGVYYPLFHVYSAEDASASLNGKVLNFEVDGDGYRHCIEDHEGLPVSTFEADRLDLIDDDSQRVMFRPNFKFPFFGAEYSEMFVSSNGFITFAGYVQSPSTAVEDHLAAAPRIAALTHDLDPIMGFNLSDSRAKPKIGVKHVTQETVVGSVVLYKLILSVNRFSVLHDAAAPHLMCALLLCRPSHSIKFGIVMDLAITLFRSVDRAHPMPMLYEKFRHITEAETPKF